MQRRAFISTLTGGLLAAPLGAEAQQAGKVARIAYVATTTPVSEMTGPDPRHPPIRQFLSALGRLGWIEGRNLIFERRSAEGRIDRFDDILRELVALPCDVIVTTGLRMTEAALRITSTIPIIFTALDPITSGVVTRLAHQGRNTTGVTGTGPEFAGKQLELFREAVPKARRVAVLTLSESWTSRSGSGDALRAAASRLAITVFYADPGPGDYARAFAAITQERADGIYLGGSPWFYADRHRLIEWAIKNRLPLRGTTRSFVEAGALIAYSGSEAEVWGRTANYVDRILRGTKVADLPIEQITKFELVINLKTAKALGLTIPQSLLGRADQVIE